jgi:hypothetical protein
LAIAGLKDSVFSEPAVLAIHQGSGGFLRKANHLAVGALVAAAREKCTSACQDCLLYFVVHFIASFSATLLCEATLDCLNQQSANTSKEYPVFSAFFYISYTLSQTIASYFESIKATN